MFDKIIVAEIECCIILITTVRNFRYFSLHNALIGTHRFSWVLIYAVGWGSYYKVVNSIDLKYFNSTVTCTWYQMVDNMN